MARAAADGARDRCMPQLGRAFRASFFFLFFFSFSELRSGIRPASPGRQGRVPDPVSHSCSDFGVYSIGSLLYAVRA